jgi:hypothetical protein
MFAAALRRGNGVSGAAIVLPYFAGLPASCAATRGETHS